MTALTVVHPLLGHVAADPTALMLAGEREWSRQQLHGAVARMAGGLLQQGVGRGDVVALDLPRSDRWILALHAIGWCGATALLVPSKLAPEQAAALLDTSRADWWLCDGPTNGKVRAPAIAPRQAVPANPAQWGLTDTRALVCTSGTSGSRTIVALSTAQWLLSTFAGAARLGHLPGDRWLHVLPLYHVGGLMIAVRAMLLGAAVELAERFDASAAWRRLCRGDVTLVSLTPRMLSQLLDEAAAEKLPNSVRAMLVGGGPLSTSTWQRALDAGWPIAASWGMTETCAQVATTVPGAEVSGALPPLPLAEISATDGRLWARGPGAERTVVTADVGDVDSSGRVTVRGRADDVIISGGAKLCPTLIETALRSHAAVADVAVVGLPHAVHGARPHAALVLRDGALRPSDRDLRDVAAAGLRNYELPDSYRWLSSLPRDAMGKLRRRIVRDQLQRLHARDEQRRDGDAAEVGVRDERMAQRDDAAMHAVRAVDPVGVSDRPIADPRDLGADDQLVVQPDRGLVAGVCVHQRHAEPQHVEVGTIEGGDEDLVETIVGVLERPREEDDAGTIDMVKPGGDAVLEWHSSSLQEGRR